MNNPRNSPWPHIYIVGSVRKLIFDGVVMECGQAKLDKEELGGTFLNLHSNLISSHLGNQRALEPLFYL